MQKNLFNSNFKSKNNLFLYNQNFIKKLFLLKFHKFNFIKLYEEKLNTQFEIEGLKIS